MQKSNVLKWLINLLFPLIFNIIFFLIEGLPTQLSIWISYLFIHLAYLLLIVSPHLAPKTSSRSIFSNTLSLISSIHFSITLILGIILIFLKVENAKICGIMHLVITGIYFLYLFVTMLVNEQTALKEENQKKGVDYIRKTTCMLEEIKGRISDSKLKKYIETIYDYVHSSPIHTTEEAKISEEIVLELLETLSSSIKKLTNDEIEKQLIKISEHMQERNRILKYSSK